MNKYIKINLLNSIIFMLLNILITILFSFIFSNSINTFTLFTGVYLFSMGIPSLIKFKFNNYIQYISQINIIINILMLILLISLTYKFNLNLIAGFIIISMLGFASGFEIPFFLKDKNNFQIIISDYVGTAIGTLLFPFLLYPFLGIQNTLVLILIIFNLFYVKISEKRKYKITFLFFNLLYILIHLLH